MSFGVSVGDFIAVGVLVKNIISALQTSSTSGHQELLLELDGLQRALHEIEHLQVIPQQETEANAVKVAALTCQYRLDDFAGKLTKYESLNRPTKASSAERAKLWRLKLQWGFSMEAELQSLRAYLIVHVGYLNMRLTTLNLTSSWHISDEIAQQQLTLEKHIADSQEAALSFSSELAAQKQMIQEGSSWTKRLTNLLSGCLLPQVAMLVDLVGKIWAMDKQIIEILMRQNSTTTALDLNHTWFQQPVKFEDALGRILPVPSEYNLGIEDKPIILDQFKAGPGHDKVSCGEYELFNSIDARHPLSDFELGTLIPGMSITMAFVIGLYEQQPVKKCPRPGCQTREFSTVASGGRRCATCNVWFDISRTKLPRPFRIPATEDVFKQIRAERKWFKNVRLFPSELPSLPLQANESGHFANCGHLEGVVSVQTTNDATLKHRVTHPSPYRTFESLPSFPSINVSQEIAIKAIRAIADICGVTVDELREICGSDPDFIDSLGLDSLLSIEVIDTITKLGVEVPRSATGSYLVQEIFESFLESFILECIGIVGQLRIRDWAYQITGEGNLRSWVPSISASRPS